MFPKPRIFVSKCLGFSACRWNGAVIPDDFIDSLKPHVEFVTACPEVEAGLGVPRDPIRLVLKDKTLKLLQLNTAKDWTSAMQDFCRRYLSSLAELDGFILKDRSPSCGLKDVKVYAGLEPGSSVKKTAGFFAQSVMDAFPHLPQETETRLSNQALREHFLTRVFTLARFRSIKARPLMKDLVQFQAENKFLLMCYSQKDLQLLGQIVANLKKKDVKTVFKDYEKNLCRILAKLPKTPAIINVIMHGFGYISKNLKADEKRFFLNTLEEYRREQVPLSVPVNLLRSYIIRFGEKYLSQQNFFSAYPAELVNIRDTGKGRELT